MEDFEVLKDGNYIGQPDIYEEHDVGIISETRLHIQDNEDEKEFQNTLEDKI